MSEEMAGFWAQVRDVLPGLLKKEGFLSAAPMGDPDELEIFTRWGGGKEEHIASLLCTAAGKFDLIVDTPGTDGRFYGDVNPVKVGVVIETAAADQVRKYLPGAERGAWAACYPLTWGETMVASFEDGDDKGANLTEFAEYACRRADKALFRESMLTVVGLLSREEEPFLMTSLPLYGLGRITLADRTIRIDTNNGRTRVAAADLDGEPKGSVEISMGPGGVSYSFCDMDELIREAVGTSR